jgi:type III secretory pathway lipoprotein EscJ
MKELWTFTSKEKLDKFLEVLVKHGIEYEASARSANEQAVSVDERDFPKARKVLLKHKERRTSADTM